jgi:hypothetical protein
MNSPKVSIIVLNWNGLKYTIECLESLKKITYPNYEVILIDNGSKENEAGVLEEKYKDYIKLIKNKENLGFAEGNNVGIRISNGEYILTLNNDTKVEPNFLDELVKCAQNHPQAGSIQTKMIFSQHPEIIDSAGLLYSRNGLGFNRGAYQSINEYTEEKEIFGCCAGACLYKRGALEDIKINDEYFDKDFFTNYEDVDLAFRLQWAGWKSWYCPKSIVYHQRGATTGVKSKFIIYHSRRNQIWTWLKNFPFSFILKNLHWLFITEIAQAGLDLLRQRPIGIKAKFDAYLNLGKILKKRGKIKKKVDFSEIEKWFILRWRIKIPKELIR